MSDRKIEITRRRVLGGVVTIGAASAAAGAGTFAMFSDEETSDGNTIQAGTLDLEVTEGDTWSFGIGNAIPGESSGTASLEIQSSGSISGNHVELAFDVTETEATRTEGTDSGDTAPDSAEGMATLFKVDTATYNGTPLTAEEIEVRGDGIADHNNNGIVDLDDYAEAGIFDELSVGGTLTLEVSFIDVDSSDNNYTGNLEDDKFQGDELTVSIQAGLAQSSGQDVL